MGVPSGFEYHVRGNGDEAQEMMARYTGNYRRGNERVARRHPRNG